MCIEITKLSSNSIVLSKVKADGNTEQVVIEKWAVKLILDTIGFINANPCSACIKFGVYTVRATRTREYLTIKDSSGIIFIRFEEVGNVLADLAFQFYGKDTGTAEEAPVLNADSMCTCGHPRSQHCHLSGQPTNAHDYCVVGDSPHFCECNDFVAEKEPTVGLDIFTSDMESSRPEEHEFSENVVTWNTGRRYSDKGQRMGAAVFGTDILFIDLDRGITGVISYLTNPHQTVDLCDLYGDLLIAYVMSAYDRSNYSDFNASCAGEHKRIQDLTRAIHVSQA